MQFVKRRDILRLDQRVDPRERIVVDCGQAGQECEGWGEGVLNPSALWYNTLMKGKALPSPPASDHRDVHIHGPGIDDALVEDIYDRQSGTKKKRYLLSDALGSKCTRHEV